MREPKVPEYLSHYTRIDVLQQILKGGLRASNILYLNDGTELIFAVDLAKDILRRFVKDRPPLHYEYDANVLSGLSTEKLPSVFATSFCKDDDLLSQWRGYGGGTQGISITFEGKLLAEMFDVATGKPAEVIYYDEKSARAKLHGLLEIILMDFDEELGAPGKTPSELAAESILELAPRIKHAGFAEEKEWRFFIQRRPADQEDLHFFSRNGLLVPYLLVNAPKLPISHITIGPSPHQLLNKQSIELLLKSEKYDDVKVSLSEVPYRG